MNEFTSSDGVHVNLSESRRLRVSKGGLVDEVYGEPRVHALREFFRAEEDERLGRWRWPENPDFIVYPTGQNSSGFRFARAVYEPTGYSQDWREGDHRTPGTTFPEQQGIRAVAAYFDAHPEPKPWLDAKPGEVWLLTMMGEELLAEAGKSSDSGTLVFWPITGEPGATQQHNPDAFTAGRRIWPEVSA